MQKPWNQGSSYPDSAVLPLKDVIPPSRFPLLSRGLLTIGAIVLPILWWQKRIDGIAAFYIVLNLLYVCVFADTVEDRLGRARFACIFLGSSVAGLATQPRNYTVVEEASAWISGAARCFSDSVACFSDSVAWFSASVAGIIGAYVVLYPNSRVLTLVPIIFYFTGVHRDYHQPTDDVDKIDFDKMERIDRMIFALGWRVANLDHRLVVDKKPTQ